nr:uncharacterized protein LOC108182677 [Danio rerio]|eukprot:XP_021326638.1 uncharacterized protein LOC108182677 [Danio rerio]
MAEKGRMEGAVNPAFQEDSEEESETRGGVRNSTLAVRGQHMGLRATATTAGEALPCPTLCKTGPASHSSAACPNRYPCIA